MVSQQEIVLRLVVATVLGVVVGLERERLDRAAGLRTHALVALGAALCMVVSAHGFADILTDPRASLDPSRLAAQVVSGIGFLGAGTIILRRDVVRGLTTAASLWTVAGLGLAAGAGLYVAATSATLLTLGVLVGLKPLQNRLFASQRGIVLRLRVDFRSNAVSQVREILGAAGLRLMTMVIRPGTRSGAERVELTLLPACPTALAEAVESLRSVPGVLELTVRTAPDRKRGNAEH
jgi:putative Mg2+ transporter-C (MgtC) family protein